MSHAVPLPPAPEAEWVRVDDGRWTLARNGRHLGTVRRDYDGTWTAHSVNGPSCTLPSRFRAAVWLVRRHRTALGGGQ